jgi:hypothetical protein
MNGSNSDDQVREKILIGSWAGTHLMNTPVRITFNDDHSVIFNNDDKGLWHTTCINGVNSLYMKFGNLLMSNNYMVTGESIILMTDRDALILLKAPAVSPIPRGDLLSMLPTNSTQGTTLPLQANHHVFTSGTDSWVSGPSMPKIYNNMHFGVSFCLPPTWFYSVADYLPVILSCLEPGMIIGRFYRPASEKALEHCYLQGYGERNVWFNPSFDSLVDISNSVFPRDRKYCKKVVHGYYQEQTGTLMARLLCIFSSFGDCYVFFGITSTNDKKFNDLCHVMNMIATSISFSPPKAKYALEAIGGTYINRQTGAVISLSRDGRFEWRCEGINDEQYGAGNWEILGSDLEGEIHLYYTGGQYKKVMYLFTTNRRVTFDQAVYDVSSLVVTNSVVSRQYA